MKFVPLKYKVLTAALLIIVATIIMVSASPDLFHVTFDDYQQPYLDHLEKVFRVMDEGYYKPVSKEVYEKFRQKFIDNVLSKLPKHGELIHEVAWRGGGLLVNSLKQPGDTFTNYIPPKQAKEYAKKVYGYQHDIGITGHMSGKGYIVDRVEKRSDSYKKGIRPGNIIISVNGRELIGLDIEEVKKLLTPELKSIVKVTVFLSETGQTETFEIVCEEYFKETVKSIPTGVSGVFCLKIEKFNRETANDLKSHIRAFNQVGMRFLIIDLRNNPGGPPLAVRELAGIFLPENTKLAYYKKRNQPLFGLSSTSSDVHYGGSMMIMVDEMSGSSSELFAGTFKAYKRAIIVGKTPTAGMAYLKGLKQFDDGAMVAMITGLSYLFNGQELGLNGVAPNLLIPPGIEDQLQFIITNITRNRK